MKEMDFARLLDGLNDALAFAKDQKRGSREHRIEESRNLVVLTRMRAGLTQAQFAKAMGASLGTVRKWESGERVPSGAAGTLVRLMARAPQLVLEEVGLRRSGEWEAQAQTSAEAR